VMYCASIKVKCLSPSTFYIQCQIIQRQTIVKYLGYIITEDTSEVDGTICRKIRTLYVRGNVLCRQFFNIARM